MESPFESLLESTVVGVYDDCDAVKGQMQYCLEGKVVTKVTKRNYQFAGRLVGMCQIAAKLIERCKQAEEILQKSQQFMQAVFSVLTTNTALIHVTTYERRSQLCPSHWHYHSGQDPNAALNQV